MNISPVIDFALQYNPMLATKDLSTIYTWVNEGCDIELDILPTMKEITERRHKMPNRDKISTFSYFNNPIRAARDKRQLAPKLAQINTPPTKEELDLLKAKSIRWLMERGISTVNSGPVSIAWLERYEEKNGRVTP